MGMSGLKGGWLWSPHMTVIRQRPFQGQPSCFVALIFIRHPVFLLTVLRWPVLDGL